MTVSEELSKARPEHMPMNSIRMEIKYISNNDTAKNGGPRYSDGI